MIKGYHIIVKGKVQGVFYRASTKETASSLGLKGWVRNLSNGDVEMSAEGDSNKLDEFIQWCKRGPMLSRVTDLEVKEVNPAGYEKFEVRY